MTEKQIIKEIDRYINGELKPDEIDLLWEQFLKNPEYFEWFETELHLKKLAMDSKKGKKKIFRSKKKTSSGRKGAFRKWMLAAAAAVVIGFGLQLFFMDQEVSFHPYSIGAIDFAEMAGADLYRSDGERPGALDVAMNQGIAYAYNSEQDKAISQFQVILAHDPDHFIQIRAEMNLGILFFNTADFKSALPHFIYLSEQEDLPHYLEEKAWWFLGNTYLNLLELAEAREAVLRTSALDGRYKVSADSLLAKLAADFVE
jgi:tetratricopeptide (TPR) repeat protein